MTTPGAASPGPGERDNVGLPVKATTDQPQAEQQWIEQLYERSRELYVQGELESARRGFAEVAPSGLYKGLEGKRPEDYIAMIDRLLAASQPDTAAKPAVTPAGRSTKEASQAGGPAVAATKPMNAQRSQADFVEVAGAEYVSLAGLASGSREAQERQRQAVRDLGVPLEIRMQKTGIVFRLVPGGSFTIGSPSNESDRESDETQHQVVLTKAFYCGKFEVTQGQWQQVMGSNPSDFQNAGADAPVESVSWDDCQTFVKTLCQLEGVPEGTYRLPTEAEWEYACRAGTQTPFAYGDDLDSTMANFDGNYPYGSGRKGQYRQTTVAAESFRPNAWGLYDMHGNVWEWCQDWYGPYPSGSVTDPLGPRFGEDRVGRGGSWFHDAKHCQSAYRGYNSPGFRNGVLGLRLARIIPAAGIRQILQSRPEDVLPKVKISY
jgi:formylglycine-generating enzyme required for sulfatase activity